MTLTPGQMAPTFSALSDNGEQISLEALRGSWTVLYFYPKAGTPGCSIEAQRFEASLPEFARLNARVIGVSTDTEAAQAKMREKCSLSFPLLPDSKKEIARAYGVIGGGHGRGSKKCEQQGFHRMERSSSSSRSSCAVV